MGEKTRISGAKELPRAKLEATFWSILISSIEISIGFLFSSFLSNLFSAWRLKTFTKKTDNTTDTTAPLSLKGKTTIVTGSNIGIGFEIAKEHFLRGAHVILACRNESRAKEAKIMLIKETGLSREEDRLEILLLDCSSLIKVREFVNDWKQSSNRNGIDYLFLNAGIADKPQSASRFTEEGFELV